MAYPCFVRARPQVFLRSRQRSRYCGLRRLEIPHKHNVSAQNSSQHGTQREAKPKLWKPARIPARRSSERPSSKWPYKLCRKSTGTHFTPWTVTLATGQAIDRVACTFNSVEARDFALHRNNLPGQTYNVVA